MTPNRNLGGIFYMLAAIALLSLMDGGLKLLAPHYPPLQVAALRGAASWPLALIWVMSTVGLRAMLRVRWPLHAARAVIGIAMMATFTYALRELPLTTAYTLFFVAPLIITALSVPVLGEKVGLGRWVAIGVGMAGVLVVMRPTGEGVFTLSGLAVLLAALGYAVSALTVRVLGRTDSTQSMVFWMLTSLAFGAGLLALPGWVPVAPEHWWIVAGVGLVGALGQYAITEAFTRTEASVIAPLEYTALAWGVGLDVLLWNILPDWITFIGAAIIVGSGLYLIRRERHAAVPDGTAAP